MRTIRSLPHASCTALTALLFAVAMQTQTYAQTQPTQAPPAAYSISGWRVECAPRSNALACQLIDQVLARANNGIIAGVSIVQSGAAKTPTMVVQVPLGVALDDGVRVSVSAGNELLLPFVSCYGTGCFARGTLSEALLSQMRGAKQPLSVSYATFDNNMNKQSVRITLPLDGFAVGYDKLK